MSSKYISVDPETSVREVIGWRPGISRLPRQIRWSLFKTIKADFLKSLPKLCTLTSFFEDVLWGGGPSPLARQVLFWCINAGQLEDLQLQWGKGARWGWWVWNKPRISSSASAVFSYLPAQPAQMCAVSRLADTVTLPPHHPSAPPPLTHHPPPPQDEFLPLPRAHQAVAVMSST